MNACTVCNSGSKVSIRLPRFAPDPGLAAVENACSLLVEGRFGPAFIFEPLRYSETEPLSESFAGGEMDGTFEDDRSISFLERVAIKDFRNRSNESAMWQVTVTIVPGTDFYCDAVRLAHLIAASAQPRGSPQFGL